MSNSTTNNTEQRASGPDAEKIQSMFNQISSGYDRANSVLSAGIHHLWRKKLVSWSGVRPGHKVLDCATGTGDLAIEFAKIVHSKISYDGQVVGTDFSPGMLEFAPAKARKLGYDIQFQLADVTNLDFADQSFNASSISFGIRNVNNPVKAISELARVVQPNGHVMVLEFGQPSLIGFRSIYNFYSKKILPTIGGWVTGQKSAYQYLQNSSANFPCREDFVDLMMSTQQFRAVEYKSLSGGIAYIYKGIKK